MPAYIGITIGGALESTTPGMAVVSSTTVSTGKDIELVLNTWPTTPVTKNQILLALRQLEDFLIQSNNLP
jgi:hypothetical protein